MSKHDYNELLFNPSLLCKRDKLSGKKQSKNEVNVDDIVFKEFKSFWKRTRSEHISITDNITDYIPILINALHESLNTYVQKTASMDQKNVNEQ